MEQQFMYPHKHMKLTLSLLSGTTHHMLYRTLNYDFIRFNTYFHKLSESAQAKSPPEQGPLLQVRLASHLPEKELRVLYRISQLTGVLLEEDVNTQGVDTSNLAVLPSCDQKELQNVRRSLHRSDSSCNLILM